jgi:hypothetical protein
MGTQLAQLALLPVGVSESGSVREVELFADSEMKKLSSLRT